MKLELLVSLEISLFELSHRADACCHKKRQSGTSSSDCFWPKDTDWKNNSNSSKPNFHLTFFI